MSNPREARIMSVRNFRAEMPDVKVIVVLPNGTIKGHWTPGTEGIDKDVLAQAMGLVAHLQSAAPAIPRQEFRPVPKPGPKKK